MLTVATEDKIEALKRYLVFLTREDYTDLSTYAYDVEDALEEDSPGELRDLTVKVVRDLVEDGLVTPGIPTAGGGFEPWAYDADRTAEILRRRWDCLGRTPELGEIVWFRATDKAAEYVEDYSPEDDELGLEPTD